MLLEAPNEGLLRNVSALPGQHVPSGAALFEIVSLSRAWVRVPVYVGDAASIAQEKCAAVGGLSRRPGDPARCAQPIPAPPSANALAGTLDLYYEVDNRPAYWIITSALGQLAGPSPIGNSPWQFGWTTQSLLKLQVEILLPAQRVGVTVPLRSESESLVAPWGAVIHDINGGTWVYEKLTERRYARRRVVVRDVIDDQAILAVGPAPGATIVKTGAAELYGIETGFSK